MTSINLLPTAIYPKVQENETEFWKSTADAIKLPFTLEDMKFSRSAEFDSQVILLTKSGERYANTSRFLST